MQQFLSMTVNLTFGTGSDTAGPDGITAKLIDNADRYDTIR